MGVQAFCEDCQRPREITDTGERRHPSRGTDHWWSFVVHSHPTGGLCPGSGRRV